MKKLSEIRDRLAMMNTLENRLSHIGSSLNSAKADKAALLRAYEEEKRDAERIQKEGFSSFVLKTIGKYEDRVEKEQQDEIDAKRAFDRAAARAGNLELEYDSLSARIDALRGEAREYERELENRRARIKSRLAGAQGALYQQLESARNGLVVRMTEIGEAQNAVGRAKATAEAAMSSLGSAEGWATYDMWTRGGIFSHMAKYSHVDEAQALFHRLAIQLGDLKSELEDVQGMAAPALNAISSSQRAVDFWFDNIFTDASVRSQIRDNRMELRLLLNELVRIEDELSGKRQAVEQLLDENRRAEEDLLVGLDDIR